MSDKSLKEQINNLRIKITQNRGYTTELKEKTLLQGKIIAKSNNTINELKEDYEALHEAITNESIVRLRIEEVLWKFFQVLKFGTDIDWNMLGKYSLEKLDSTEDRQPGGTDKKTKKKESECPYCHGLIKFRRKYKSGDEDIIYEFYCPKCKKKIRGEYPDSFLKTDLGGEKEDCSHDCSKSLTNPPTCDRCPENPDFWNDNFKCEYLWQQTDDIKRCTHDKNSQPNMRLDGETPGFCTEDKCPLKTEPEKYQLKFRDIIIDVIDIIGYNKDDEEVKKIREYLESINNEYVLTKIRRELK